MLLPIALVFSPPVMAQGLAPSAGPSFMIARFASRGALTFYGGYRVGPAFGFVGMVQNPRTQYREALAGVGRNVMAENGNGVTVGLAGAYASDGWYAQLYLLPALRTGPFDFNATIEFYEPLERDGARQIYTTPANGYLVLSNRLAVGATYLLSAQHGQAAGHAAGPSVRLTIPRGSLTLDLVGKVTRAHDEVRLTARSYF